MTDRRRTPLPGAEREAERGVPLASLAALGSLGAALILVYPFLEAMAAQIAGVRLLAALGCAACSLLAVLLRRITAAVPRWRRVQWALLALLVLAAISGWDGFLLCMPAAVLLGLADLCAASLRGAQPLAHRVALFIEPRAPDWIGPYCRKLTAAWALFFALNAAAIAALAWLRPDLWPAYTRFGIWAITGAAMAGEFVLRKAWFRHYIPISRIDRLLAWLLPAERTERGRRSAAYMQPFIAEHQRRDALLREARKKT